MKQDIEYAVPLYLIATGRAKPFSFAHNQIFKVMNEGDYIQLYTTNIPNCFYL